MTGKTWDVAVVGAGNAGFCAAIAAAQAGASVIMFEAAESQNWGGNSALTMNFRFPHARIEDLLGFADRDLSNAAKDGVRGWYEAYSPAEYLADLVRVSGGRCDPALAEALVQEASDDAAWLQSLGHRWILRDRANAVPGAMPIRIAGGGSALQARHLAAARRLGVTVRFSHRLAALEAECRGFRLTFADRCCGALEARCVVLACGSFEANPDMRAEYLGEPWRAVALRGVPTNRGDGLQCALALGAGRAGDWSTCHATPQSASLPGYMLPSQGEESQRNSRYAFNLGITVNRHGERFVDEGSDYPNLVYATMGRAILAQPDAIAFQLFDHATVRHLPPGYFVGGDLMASPSLAALAVHFEIDPAGLECTVRCFNAAAHQQVDYGRRDRRATAGLKPAKSNWALRLDSPPYYIVPVRAGITFAFGGLRVDPVGQVLRANLEAIPGLYACGEMAGGLFFGNYVGGSGLMFGTHLGRKAGRHAAIKALDRLKLH